MFGMGRAWWMSMQCRSSRDAKARRFDVLLPTLAPSVRRLELTISGRACRRPQFLFNCDRENAGKGRPRRVSLTVTTNETRLFHQQNHTPLFVRF
jgi:hypothetical protein